MNFASTLKQLRETKNITQEELAEYLQVSRPTIAGYETKNRQPDYERLEKISRFFQVSIDYLLTGSTCDMDVSVVQQVSAKALDGEVASAYRKLSLESKREVLKYIELLQLKDAHPREPKNP